MNQNLQLLDVVALVGDRLDQGLVSGQVGTIVEELGEGVFEVEFSDEEGRSYASLALLSDELLGLHYSPVAA